MNDYLRRKAAERDADLWDAICEHNKNQGMKPEAASLFSSPIRAWPASRRYSDFLGRVLYVISASLLIILAEQVERYFPWLWLIHFQIIVSTGNIGFDRQ